MHHALSARRFRDQCYCLSLARTALMIATLLSALWQGAVASPVASKQAASRRGRLARLGPSAPG